jgi:hypothetical protein
MDSEKQKNRKVEWSFSFEKVADDIGDFFKSMGMSGEEQIKTAEFSDSLAGATSARVRLDLSVGETTIKPVADPANLFEANLTYVGEVEFAATGEGERTVTLAQANPGGEWFRNVFGWIGSGQKLRWDIGLSSAVPVELDVHGGVGRCEFDLTTLKPRAITIAGGAGEITLALPAATEPYTANINAGVGRSSISIPGGTTVNLTARIGTGETNVSIGDNAAVTARISGGVGATNLILPANAAVRIEVKTGIGGVNIPAHIPRVSSSGGEFWEKGGVYQTPGYELAARRITIHFDAGIGALNVQ